MRPAGPPAHAIIYKIWHGSSSTCPVNETAVSAGVWRACLSPGSSYRAEWNQCRLSSSESHSHGWEYGLGNNSAISTSFNTDKYIIYCATMHVQELGRKNQGATQFTGKTSRVSQSKDSACRRTLTSLQCSSSWRKWGRKHTQLQQSSVLKTSRYINWETFYRTGKHYRVGRKTVRKHQKKFFFLKLDENLQNFTFSDKHS